MLCRSSKCKRRPTLLNSDVHPVRKFQLLHAREPMNSTELCLNTFAMMYWMLPIGLSMLIAYENQLSVKTILVEFLAAQFICPDLAKEEASLGIVARTAPFFSSRMKGCACANRSP